MSKGTSRGTHLTQRRGWWYFQRRRPEAYADVETRRWIVFSLGTRDHAEARLKAARISLELDHEWEQALARGVSLRTNDAAKRFQAAVEVQQARGFTPSTAETLTDDELLARLRSLILNEAPHVEQSAVLGLTAQPSLSLTQAFDRFWEHIRDEWMKLSHDQQRVKRNIFRKAIRNFEQAVGSLAVEQIDRSHALAFRSWWMDRVAKEGLKPYTANNEINSLRRVIRVNFDIDAITKANPFAKVQLKDEEKGSRIPLSTDQVRAILAPGAMENLHADFQLLLRLLVNMGMRPVEAIGLAPEDILLDHAVPHVHVRKNAIRGLKTPHSERLLPLLGVSLAAAKQLAARGGWGERAGKNMYATSIINRRLKAAGLFPEEKQSLYSLRHWFQDQLTKRDVVDRAQAQLMGHRFHRPKYGYGKAIEELREIIRPFAL